MTNKDIICYIEDELGGFFCYEKDVDYFIKAEEGAVVCFKGDKEQVEEYVGCIIEDNMISKR